MWDYQAILRDLQGLAQRSCVDEELANCSALLALPPINDFASQQPSSIRPYVLREFLRSVVDNADAEDRFARAAGALIGTDSPGRSRQYRIAQAAAILDRGSRTVRRHETKLLQRLAQLIIDFARDPKTMTEFVRNHQAWPRPQAPAGDTGSAARRDPGPPPSALSSKETAEPPDLADILHGLTDAAKEDKVAASLLDGLQSGIPVDKLALTRLERILRLQADADKLGEHLLATVRGLRPESTDESGKRLHYPRHAAELMNHALLHKIYAEIAILVLARGYFWLTDESEPGQRVRQALHAIFRLAPFRDGDDSWLNELLEEPQPGQPVNWLEREHNMPSMSWNPDVEQQWREYVATCHCTSDETPDEQCRVHALIKACDELSHRARVYTIHRLQQRPAN